MKCCKCGMKSIIPYLTKAEVKDLCFCINNFGDRNEGIVAYPDNVKFYLRKYVDSCIENALNTGKLSDDGTIYIQKLKTKLEKF